jgi:hypothetical protein
MYRYSDARAGLYCTYLPTTPKLLNRNLTLDKIPPLIVLVITIMMLTTALKPEDEDDNNDGECNKVSNPEPNNPKIPSFLPKSRRLPCPYP